MKVNNHACQIWVRNSQWKCAFSMHVFRERASAINQTRILSHGRPQVVRDVILSSKPKYSERKYGLRMWKKRIFLCECSSFAKKFEANMPAYLCVVQDCSNKSNPRIGISLHTPKSNSELAKWKSFVRTHSSNFNLNGLFKIYSVHFSATALSGPFIKKEHRDHWLLDLFLQFGHRLWRARSVPYRLEVGDWWVNKPLTFPKLFAGFLVSAG